MNVLLTREFRVGHIDIALGEASERTFTDATLVALNGKAIGIEVFDYGYAGKVK